MRSILLLFYLLSFAGFAQDVPFEMHGHRGYRGMYPENTIVAFKEAVKAGIRIIELDIVVSKDSQLVVSHEPWFNPKICSDPQGRPVKVKTNFYKLEYDSIRKYDCGKRGNKKFPEQLKVAANKPLLKEVIEQIEKFCAENGLSPVTYNIEIKSRKFSDNKYHPQPFVTAKLLADLLNNYKIVERVLVQSFDERCLREIHSLIPQIRVGVLVIKPSSISRCIKRLGFIPYMYNPNVKFVNERSVKKIHAQNVKVIVWTVNKEEEVQKLKKFGVDGIITDFPGKFK